MKEDWVFERNIPKSKGEEARVKDVNRRWGVCRRLQGLREIGKGVFKSSRKILFTLGRLE